MRLRDMTIGTQLALGLGLLFALVAALGVLAWRQGGVLWEQTQMTVDHPLAVSRAIGELDASVEAVSRAIRDLVLASDESQIDHALEDTATERANIDTQLAIVRERYLGPTDDLEALEQDLARWDSLRTETIRLVRADRTDEAIARIGPGGAQHEQATLVRAHLRSIVEFARGKSEELHATATAEARSLRRQLALFLCLFVVCAIAISTLLTRAIRTPLAELRRAAERFREGELDARARYEAHSELGQLARTFNGLATEMQAQLALQEQLATLNTGMLEELEAREFGLRLLSPLVEQTGSQVGAIYLLDEEADELVPVESIGLDADALPTFSASKHEGEVGAAVCAQTIRKVSDIPADTPFAHTTVSGKLVPREIVTIPLSAGHEVRAAISLASVRKYSPAAMRLLERAQAGLSVWLSGMLASRRIGALTEGLASRNRTLEEQRTELVAQANELVEMNAELEAQRRQLTDANRHKSTFLSNMSHELRTPLNSVIALSGVLYRRGSDKLSEEERGYLEVIERNGRVLLGLINDILDLSRIESGREPIRREPVALGDLVLDLVAALEPEARNKAVEMRVDLPADLPSVVSDPDKIRRIVGNLLANAVKFTAEGEVLATVRERGERVEVAVTDTGIGIAPDKLEAIFEEFRQADDTTARAHGGSGLGLAIARRYARLLGGDIRASSELGAGSTFTLWLPRGETDARALEGAADATRGDGGPDAARAAGARRILLVEDSEPARVQIADVLEPEGYVLETAADGREALESLADSLPDAIILDLMMPHVDGFEVLRRLRAADRTRHLPVLILTAKHVSEEELSVLTSNHVHQLIHKGDIDRRGLLRAVARMTASKPDRGVAAPEVPASTAPARASARRSRPPAAPSETLPLVLVVEDDADNRRSIEAMLVGSHRIATAEDVRSAIEQARALRPALILMDIGLPDGTGEQALRLLREDEALGDTPVIAVTANALAGDRERLLSLGFDAYVPKPVDHARLLEAIRQLLDEPDG